jgi:hypothetical protein
MWLWHPPISQPIDTRAVFRAVVLGKRASCRASAAAAVSTVYQASSSHPA